MMFSVVKPWTNTIIPVLGSASGNNVYHKVVEPVGVERWRGVTDEDERDDVSLEVNLFKTSSI